MLEFSEGNSNLLLIKIIYKMTNKFQFSKIILMVFTLALFLNCNSGPKSSEQDKAKENLEEKTVDKESDKKFHWPNGHYTILILGSQLKIGGNLPGWSRNHLTPY